jgi:proline iminopeptidase
VRPDPVVLLHGGPGTPGSGPGPLGVRIAARGFDVYAYDQIGAGRSERLADPTGYTVARNVADLEAVRRTLGVQRMVLIGTSWGATWRRPTWLPTPTGWRAWSSSPPVRSGRPAWADRDEGDIWDRVPPGPGAPCRRDHRRQPTAAWNLLMQISPRAAHALVGDDEVDALFAEVVRTVASAGSVTHRRAAAAREPPRLLRQPAGRRGRAASPGPRPALRVVRTPALVLRGACDYKRPEIAAEYAATLPGAILKEIPDAGHLIRTDQPEAYRKALLSFLDVLERPW